MPDRRWMLLGMLGALPWLDGCVVQTAPADAGPDAGGCPITCDRSEDCCRGSCCSGGRCVLGCLGCPTGCNLECSRARGERCDRDSLTCVQGTPGTTCQTDCDCYAGEKCDQGACVPACEDDEACEPGMQCRDSRCQPRPCETREDCGSPDACLVCRDGACGPEPVPCWSDRDCCEGRRCDFVYFWECSSRIMGRPCASDEDCEQGEICVEGWCAPGNPRCLSHADCPADWCCDPGTGNCWPCGCTRWTCPRGEWCNATEGRCQPGCDTDEDCPPEERCDVSTHACATEVDACHNACGPAEFCDPFTASCYERCSTEPACRLANPPSCCPAGFACETESGRCLCADGACPLGAVCEAASGECAPAPCEPACAEAERCLQGTCLPPGTGQEGAPCYQDEDCDQAAGFLCDGSIFCIMCGLLDETFSPGFVCREACAMFGTCSLGGHECRYRHVGLQFLCVPPGTP
jgi:hypothetical protein